MLRSLDHLVILVRDLDQAVRGYEGLRFAVTPGGEHADGLIRMNSLERALMRADRRGNSVAILFLDLDDFKVINDSLGHDTGDQLLLEIGRCLDSGVRVSDTVARLGDDEFVVLLDDVGDKEEAALVADRISKELGAPFELGERQLHVTASIGVAIRINQEGGPRGLLRDADLAMYTAKEKGKNRYEVYYPSTPTRRSG